MCKVNGSFLRPWQEFQDVKLWGHMNAKMDDNGLTLGINEFQSLFQFQSIEQTRTYGGKKPSCKLLTMYNQGRLESHQTLASTY